MKNINWENTNVVVVLHKATSGMAYDLKDYLIKKRVPKLLFITHPLLFIPENYKKCSTVELYIHGELKVQSHAYNWKLPEYLLYVKDFFYTILWTIKYGRSWNIYIGYDNLNALAGIVLRFLGIVDTVIYYVIDYIPQRFNNSILNSLYHYVEKLAARYSNKTWNLSPRMLLSRNKKWHTTFKNQLVVPHGVYFDRIKRLPSAKVRYHEIVYMGTLLEKQGIQLMIGALPEIIKKLPKVSLSIIGTGPYKNQLIKKVKSLKLTSVVRFHGYIENHRTIEDMIARAGIAIALYDKDVDTFTYHSDPGKVKSYLGAGVPVIMTDVPHVAREIERSECGLIVKYNADSLSEAIQYLMGNKKRMKDYRKNAVAFSRKFDWNTIFENAFSKTI